MYQAAPAAAGAAVLGTQVLRGTNASFAMAAGAYLGGVVLVVVAALVLKARWRLLGARRRRDDEQATAR